MKSALYEGVVRHLRTRPVRHGFARRLYMAYLDLDELDTVFRGRWLWSTRRPAPVRFRREDHLGDPAQPLDHAVRSLVAERTGRRPAGPVRLLTQLRHLGYGFNPLSLFYCFDAGDRRVEAVVAEVSNTPWNERHGYVLSDPERLPDGRLRFDIPKAFHVSPFMGMEQTYAWSLSEPGEELAVRIQSREHSPRPLFHAALELRRRPITGPALARMLVRYPGMTAQVIAAIYWQAMRLRRKGVPEHPHPGRSGVPHTGPEITAP